MKNYSVDLPDEFYGMGEELANDILPILQDLVEDLADEYDMPTALGIGGVAMIFLLCGLANTHDDQLGMPPYDTANLELARAISEAMNKRLQASVSRANGELN